VKLFRVFVAVFLTCSTFVVCSLPTGKTPTETVALTSDTSRDVDARASRSDVAVTTTEPSTTTTSSTTTSSTTTSTTSPPVPHAAARAKPVKSEPKTAAVAPPASTGGNQRVVQIAYAQVGKAYVSAAEGPNAFDCSGLVFYVFNQAGIHIPRLSSDGYLAKYPKVSRAALQPGDLIVSSGHIAIYVGNGKIVHASTPRDGVKVSPVDSGRTPIGYVRIG